MAEGEMNLEADVKRRLANPPPLPMDPEWYAQKNPGTPTPEQAQFNKDVAGIGGGGHAKSASVAYNVEGPDGAKYRVDGPAGMTEDMARQAVAREHYGWNPAPKERPDEMIDPLTNQKASSTPHMWNNTDSSTLGGAIANSPLAHTIYGAGAEAERLVRGAGNSLGLISDRDYERRRDENNLITDNTAGKIGAVGEDVLAGLPVSEGLGLALGAARGLPLVGRALGSPATRSVLDAATQSAATAEPGERTEAAEEGGLFGGVLHGALKAAGRVTSGLIQKSQDTKDLEHLVGQYGKDIHIPASIAGDSSGDLTSKFTQGLYRNALALFPGVAAQLEHHASQARSVVNDIAGEEASPLDNLIKEGAMSKDPIQSTQTLADAINKEVEQSVGSYRFNVPTDMYQQIAAKIQQLHPEIDATSLQKAMLKVGQNVERYGMDGQRQVGGMSLLEAREASLQAVQHAKDPVEKKALEAAASWIDDHIYNEMSFGKNAQGETDFARWQNTLGPAENLRVLQSAVGKAKAQGGRFTPAQLAQSAPLNGPMATLAQSSNNVLGQPVVMGNTAGRALVYSAGGLGAHAAGLLSIPGTLKFTILGNLLATKVMQRVAMGDNFAQKFMQKTLAAHPGVAKNAALLSRLTGASLIGQDNGGSSSP